MRPFLASTRYHLLPLFGILLLLSGSPAGEITHSYVDYEDGHYLVRLVMKIEADMETVYSLLTDFDQLTKLNDSIKVSRLLHSNDKQHRILIEMEGCVWIFCRRVNQVQQVTEMGMGYIKAVTLPDQSDMEYGRVLWHIQQQDNVTVISYSADVIPAFFVPPLIGPYLMKDRLLEEAEKTIRGIERLARQKQKH